MKINMLSVLAQGDVNVLLNSMITMELMSLESVQQVSTLYFLAGCDWKIIWYL